MTTAKTVGICDTQPVTIGELLNDSREPLKRIAGPRQRRVPLIQIKQSRLPRHQAPSIPHMERIESSKS
jgi:hypothetical protein